MNHRLLVTLLFGIATSIPGSGVSAQAPGGQPSEEDQIAKRLFAPELVMQHQQRIGLKPTQRTTITEAIGKTQGKVLDLQWRMKEEWETLVSLLDSSTIDEAAALAATDRVLGIEREVKKEHLSLLIKIKNVLTREQQEKLKEFHGTPPRGLE